MSFYNMNIVQSARTRLWSCKFAELCRQYLAGLLGTYIECKRDATSVIGKSIICSDGHEAATYALRKMSNKRHCFEDAVMSPSTAVICRGLPFRQKNPWYCTLPSLQENEISHTDKLCTSGHSSTAQSSGHRLCQYGSQTTADHLPNMVRNWFALKDSVLPRVRVGGQLVVMVVLMTALHIMMRHAGRAISVYLLSPACELNMGSLQSTCKQPELQQALRRLY